MSVKKLHILSELMAVSSKDPMVRFVPRWSCGSRLLIWCWTSCEWKAPISVPLLPSAAVGSSTVQSGGGKVLLKFSAAWTLANFCTTSSTLPLSPSPTAPFGWTQPPPFSVGTWRRKLVEPRLAKYIILYIYFFFQCIFFIIISY